LVLKKSKERKKISYQQSPLCIKKFIEEIENRKRKRKIKTKSRTITMKKKNMCILQEKTTTKIFC